MSTSPEGPVLLFDGVCNLCNAAVLFVVDRDPRGAVRFAALQSDAGAALLAAHGRAAPTGDPDSMVLVESGRLYERSTAALRVARHLAFPWPLFAAFLVVPRPLRDAVYRVVARLRYRLFGKSDTCRVPTPELRARFLG